MIEDLRACDNEVTKEIQHTDGLYSWRKYRTNGNKLIVKKEQNKNFLGRYLRMQVTEAQHVPDKIK